MIKTAYIHARPQGHPTHKMYADSLNPDQFYYDYLIRWHDKKAGVLKKLLSWVACALFFPGKKKYQVFYSDGITYFPVLLKKLFLINRKSQKLIALQGDETLFFLKQKRYSVFGEKLIRWAYLNYDALICIGRQQSALAKEVLVDKCPPVYEIVNGVDSLLMQNLLTKKPDLSSSKLLFIANITTENRAYYKGLDVLLEAFSKAIEQKPDLELHLAGHIDPIIANDYITKYYRGNQANIKMIGYINSIGDFLEDYALYVHLSRGEVWGMTVAEAALGGLPVIISNQTGIKEVINNTYYEVDINPEEAAQKIIDYFNSDINERNAQVVYLREQFKKYTEEDAVENFKQNFLRAYRQSI